MAPGMRYDENKFAELLLYVAKGLEDDPAGGAIKLNKVLFYAEFGHVRATGQPITGAEYQRLPLGPAPRRLLPVRDQLIGAGDAYIVVDTFVGYTQDRLVATREPNVTYFTEDELASIDQALVALRGMTGAEVTDLSHDEVGWQMVDDGETIPFETAFLRRGDITPAVADHAHELAVQHGLIS